MSIKFVSVILFVSILLSFVGCTASKDSDDGRIDIVATIFPYFDFARSVTGDSADVTILLPPGGETHSYEPSAQDIIRIQNCDLFIYTGGASDAWVETILRSLDTDVKVLKAMDYVELFVTETVDGMTDSHTHDHDHDNHSEDDHDHSHNVFDEHIWTSPVNAAKITSAICDSLCELDIPDTDKTAYAEASEKYISELEQLDSEFRSFFDSCNNKTLVFGDRFPFRYFIEEYDLNYYAAFPGCSGETEMSASNLVFMIDTVKKDDISTILYIEFSNHQVADSIAESTGASTALLHSCHNVSKAEIENGTTYLTLMNQNLSTLKEVLD